MSKSSHPNNEEVKKDESPSHKIRREQQTRLRQVTCPSDWEEDEEIETFERVGKKRK